MNINLQQNGLRQDNADLAEELKEFKEQLSRNAMMRNNGAHREDGESYEQMQELLVHINDDGHGNN